ncbi:MAG TPA: UvrD-helicase domain-containing protein, partial [Polyangiaceae bacterium]|nr:UvrD-helicase domain-containing protein [Polyangiaceae bacterium]
MGYPGLFRNAVVAASAGTGKTRFLTNLFVARALGLGADERPVAAERMVATTFSRAAALELRERIERKLSELAERAGSLLEALDPPLAERARAQGLTEATLRERARRALGELPGATIDTLHGVAAWVLRRHALELGLVPNFAILDEQQASADLDAVIDDSLALALEGNHAERRAVLSLIDACRGLDNTELALRYVLERLDDEGLVASEAMGGGETEVAAQLAAELGQICQAILRDPASALSEPARALEVVLRSGEQRSLSDLGDALGLLFEVKLTAALKRQPGAA